MEADYPDTDDGVFGVSFNGKNRAYPHRTDTERCSPDALQIVISRMYKPPLIRSVT